MNKGLMKYSNLLHLENNAKKQFKNCLEKPKEE